jgi:hypothetical protein
MIWHSMSLPVCTGNDVVQDQLNLYICDADTLIVPPDGRAAHKVHTHMPRELHVAWTDASWQA